MGGAWGQEGSHGEEEAIHFSHAGRHEFHSENDSTWLQITRSNGENLTVQCGPSLISDLSSSSK